jgi:hypothetical protein
MFLNWTYRRLATGQLDSTLRTISPTSRCFRSGCGFTVLMTRLELPRGTRSNIEPIYIRVLEPSLEGEVDNAMATSRPEGTSQRT